MDKTTRRAILSGLAAALPLVASYPRRANASDVAWQALTAPTAIVFMRHADAPGTLDPPGFSLDSCASQRNLDDRGRAQARRIGEALRARGVTFERRYTSQWCRCRETAAVVLGVAAEDLPLLNSFLPFPERRAAQITALREHLKSAPRYGRALYVTHQVVITALVDIVPASGELVVIDRDGPAPSPFRLRARLAVA